MCWCLFVDVAYVLLFRSIHARRLATHDDLHCRHRHYLHAGCYCPRYAL